MWQCSRCHAEVADSRERCWVCGDSAGNARSGGRSLPPIMAELVERPARWPPPGPQVGLPRQFGIGTLMILTAAFAVMFSLMKMLDTLPEVFVCVSLFVAGVAACQVLMYQGKNPRKASFVGGYIVGGVVSFVFALGWAIYWHAVGLFFSALISGFFLTALLGGPCGYLAGCVVAGIFLAWKDRGLAPTEEVGPGGVEPPTKGL
jgi:hypothetical protein